METRKKAEVHDSYVISEGKLEAQVTIEKEPGERLASYRLELPKLEAGTIAFLKEIQPELLKKVSISTQEALNIKMAEQLKGKFLDSGMQVIKANMPNLSPAKVEGIARRLVHDMLGMGDVEFLLRDDNIEEVCINGALQPIWIYHRKYGWMRTNLSLENENQIWNYASGIARGVGRQITTKTPMLDAYLSTGDRVNATIFPISYFGNTITIRKFARKPWTITDYIRMKTISSEVAALLWLSIQYEMNLIVAGGTGAGKTSMLNVLSMFIPENQRVISIEQTREIALPSFLQWVPLVVRESTGDGAGSVSMLDLMVNTLRMRPDRMIVGEIRRAEEAEVLFEAMHTGHSVYATLHAETVSETINRLINPPISVQPLTLQSLHLIVAMYRDRRGNIRRVYEVGEIVPTEHGVKENVLYRWHPVSDRIDAANKSLRLMDAIKTYTNMSEADIKNDLREKKFILEWMVAKNISSVEEVGKVISEYYSDPDAALKRAGQK
jgi:archaeal flagellar protein FlaI